MAAVNTRPLNGKTGKHVRYAGEPELPRPRSIAMHAVIVERHPDCLMHPTHPFDVLYPDQRMLIDLDFDEPECLCKWEAHPPKDKGTEPRQSKRICPHCFQQRSLAGTCWC